MYQRILIPIDGSEPANKALIAALQMARDSGGIVHLIHVVEGLSPLTVDPYGAYTDEVTAAMRQSGSKILEDAKMIAQARAYPLALNFSTISGVAWPKWWPTLPNISMPTWWWSGRMGVAGSNVY